MTLINGDCLIEMKKMEANSISCIVTDPPYGLGFMGKEWDAGLPHQDIWKEALRICKPGAFLLAFAGSGTTILAAQNLGVKAIGIELSAEYAEIAEVRLRKKKPEQLDLFELEKVS